MFAKYINKINININMGKGFHIKKSKDLIVGEWIKNKNDIDHKIKSVNNTKDKTFVELYNGESLVLDSDVMITAIYSIREYVYSS